MWKKERAARRVAIGELAKPKWLTFESLNGEVIFLTYMYPKSMILPQTIACTNERLTLEQDISLAKSLFWGILKPEKNHHDEEMALKKAFLTGELAF
jgi:hypothetical protein